MGGDAGGNRRSPPTDPAPYLTALIRREIRRMADPPNPIPPHLAPIEAPLGEGDLVFVATRDELEAMASLAKAIGMDPSLLRIVHRDGSPWIEFVVVLLDREARAWNDRVGALVVAEPQRFALWRYTLAVYRIGSDGAVEDEPVWRPTT